MTVHTTVAGMLVIGWSLLSLSLPAQTPHNEVIITGSVTDTKGSPIAGATVAVKNKKGGAVTDDRGTYHIPAPSNGWLVTSFVGYKTKEVPVNGSRQVDIQLETAPGGLSDVIVVGYGAQKKATLTGSVVSVSGDDLKQAPLANVGNALVGRVPGLMATQASGEPGANAATLRIRGAATLNSDGQDPLIIIDGIQQEIYVLNGLDANEIDNISVLKDASATAVYGVRGANGVIIVSTKRGKAGRPRIGFSFNQGITQLTSKLQLLRSYDYALFRNEAIKSDADPSFNQYLFSDDDLWKFQHNRDYTDAEVDAMDLTPKQRSDLKASPALYYTSHDYFDEEFANAAPQSQYNLNLSGGSKTVQYFVSAGYFSQKGLLANSNYGGANVNSNYDRYNFRSNLDIEAAHNLKISVNIGGQVATNSGILGKDSATDLFSRYKELTVMTLESSPYAGPGIVDGHLVVGFVNQGDPIKQQKGGGGYSPIAYLLTRPTLTRNVSTLNSTIKVVHKMDYLTRGLSANATFSYNDSYTKGTYRLNQVPQYTAMRDPDNPATILFFGGAVGPSIVKQNWINDKWRRVYMEASLDYTHSFNSHTVTALVLFNAQKTYSPSLQYNVPEGLMGVVSRITYNYKGRYLAEGDLGYNGSENFPKNRRFGLFPAVSAGWVLSNESFFPKNDWVNWVKFRASYGEVGNDKIGGNRFLYLSNSWGYNGYGPLQGYFFGNSNGSSQSPYYNGAYESRIGNPDVTWERAKKTNFGVEMKLLTNRLSLTADLFSEKRDNILISLGTVPALTGATLPPANLGKVSNHGYELQAGWEDQTGKLTWFIRGGLSYARNKIEYMDEPAYPYPWMNATGFPIGQYKGYYQQGFYNTAAEAASHPYSNVDGNHVQAGDLRYADLNKDGKIDLSDKGPIGYSNLPQYAFNWSFGGGFKGFDLSVLFNGTANGSFPLQGFDLINPFYYVNGNAMQWQYDGRWTPEKAQQGITPTFPRASLRTYTSQNGAALSSFWLRSNNYIRLKNVEIGYSVQHLGMLKKAGVSAIRIYANANNLHTWAPGMIPGLDPEQQDSGGASSGYVYPMTRVFNFGANIQF